VLPGTSRGRMVSIWLRPRHCWPT